MHIKEIRISAVVRPWILFPYKSLKSEIALTLKHVLTLKLQEVVNFVECNLSCDQTIHFIHVCVR